MTAKLHRWWAAALIAAMISPASAEEPRIKIAQQGADALRADLKYLVGLAPGNLKNEWKNLDETLESFLPGVDSKKPIRFDVILGKKEVVYQPSFPVTKLEGRDGFLDNVGAFGYNVKKNAAGYFDLTEQGAGTKYFLRSVGGYALIGQRLADVPANAPDPAKGVAHLLAKGEDVGAELDNDPKDADSRRSDFQSLRQELEAAVKFKRGESKPQFELRKLLVEHQFNELERFVVESDLVRLGWTTDAAKKVGNGTFLLTALEGTDLAKSVEILGEKPSAFADVKLHDSPVVSGKINFAIDPMRLKHAKEMYEKLRPVSEERIDARKGLNAEQKTAAKKAANIAYDIVVASLALEVTDGYIDLHAVKGDSHTLTAGIRAKDGNRVKEIVELLPSIKSEWKVIDETDVNGVTVYQLPCSKERIEGFQALFGKDQKTFYLGGREDSVWVAAGPGALDELKTAIGAFSAEGGKADPTILYGTVKAGPLVKVFDIFRDKTPRSTDGATKAEKDRIKAAERARKLATDAFATGNDTFTYTLKREKDQVIGTMTVNEGILRFVGASVADFAHENLR